MKTPEWELSALIAAPLGTELTLAGEVWRKVRFGHCTYWRNEIGEKSPSFSLMRRMREARLAQLEG